jgi:hypothetical protein
MNVYFFGWPGQVGGADTKLDHLLPLLQPEFDLTVVPSSRACLQDSYGKRRLEELQIPCASLEQLPERLSGWGVALCNGTFLSSGMAHEARRRGLRLAWSNEMMCLFPAERGAMTLGLWDTVLFVSQAQRRVLEPQYQRILAGESALSPFLGQAADQEGWIGAPGTGRRLRWVMVGNFIDARAFPFRQRNAFGPNSPALVVGRLSRADPAKFPRDFPQFYEGLGLRQPRFRVMAWSRRLAAQWFGHVFDERWDLLPALSEPAASFLQSLDLFVYSLHPSCRESWGRAVVEAMLSGAVPLVPEDEEGHWGSLVAHGETGFICPDTAAFGQYARLLEREPDRLQRMASQARATAVKRLCHAEEHRHAWRRLFYGPPAR